MKKQGRINQVFACDINPKRLESLPQSVDGKFSSWREMCSKISFDLVTIATPNPTHYLLGREIMSMGMHVLIEKPTATSSSEVAKLSQIAAQYSSNLHSGYLLRYHPVVLEAEKKIRRGDIGVVKSIRYVKYSSRDRSAGSNIVSGLASHAFDTVPYLANLRLNPLVLSAVAFNHDELAPLDKASKGNIRLQYKDVQRASNIEVEVTGGVLIHNFQSQLRERKTSSISIYKETAAFMLIHSTIHHCRCSLRIKNPHWSPNIKTYSQIQNLLNPQKNLS